MKELELKHIVGYLPYGLKSEVGIITGLDPTIVSVERDNRNFYYYYTEIKPFLRPLSDLKNEDTIAIHGLCSIDLELIDIEEWTEELIHEIKTGQKFKLSCFEYLFSKHFDIFGLIENNLAIDINTL